MQSAKKFGFGTLKYTACLAALALCLTSAAPQSAFADSFVVGTGGAGGAGGTGGYAGGAGSGSRSSDSFGNTTGSITDNMTGNKLWVTLPSGTGKANFNQGGGSSPDHGFNKGGGSASHCFAGNKC